MAAAMMIEGMSVAAMTAHLASECIVSAQGKEYGPRDSDGEICTAAEGK